MKKILFTILLCLKLSFIPVALAAPLDNINNADLQTRLILDSNMRPDNSPGVTFSNEQDLKDNTKNSESQFGNFLLQILAGGLLSIAAPVAVIIIAYSGLQYATARGAQAQMDKAKQTLTQAVIGLVIIIFSWVIVRSVINAVVSVNSNQNQATTQSAAPAAGGTTGGAGNPGDQPSAPPKIPGG